MIAYIKGNVAWVEEGAVVIDHQGMGYRVMAPSTVVEAARPGEEIFLYTYFAVREDAMQLFGFLSREDLQLFELLLGVSGVGPKAALGILSTVGANDLRFAILGDDAALIAKAPGVGKKTAQKVILELKDKLDLMEAFEASANAAEAGAGGVSQAGAGGAENQGEQQDAILALTALGYGRAEAMKAVKAAAQETPGATSEDLIRAALKHM
ncbi:MAG: Holliday junction branch migration protein RuvA [Lachnospiraceae bacterium]|nr:Holliday junction branch migration protein RuvA [Lachnospiraceae bacterium]